MLHHLCRKAWASRKALIRAAACSKYRAKLLTGRRLQRSWARPGDGIRSLWQLPPELKRAALDWRLSGSRQWQERRKVLQQAQSKVQRQQLTSFRVG